MTAYFKILNDVEITLKSNKEVIQSLSARCEELQVKVSDLSQNNNLSFLLNMLLKTSQKNSAREKHGNTFEKDIKYFSIYLFIIAGRSAYEFVYENMKPALPSLSEIDRILSSSSSPVREGKFRFDELSEFLNNHKLPRKVYVSEDGTRVIQKFLYDLTSDQIIGPVPPLAYSGVPIINSFPASSAAMIASHFDKGTPSSSAYVLMAQPIKNGAPAFCLCIFGTDNKFSSEQICRRWHYIHDELKKRDVEIVGFSADGDPKMLSAMHYHMFKDGPLLSESFKDFYFVSEQTFCVLQDHIHTVNKFRSRLSPTNYLPIGNFTASQTHLRILIDDVPKEDHWLTPTDLDKDKMNFNSSIKICSDRVRTALKDNVPGSDGTVAYLEVMNNVMEAGLNETLSALEKIYKLWYAVWFLRIWRSWLLANPEFNLLDNFVTRNLYVCVEINAHSLIHLIIKCRNEECPDSFLFHLFSSQPCESFFRLARSMTSTESTVINFTMKELLQKVRRIDMLHHVAAQLGDKLVFPREKRKSLLAGLAREKLCSTYFPSDEEIMWCVSGAESDALAKLRELGVTCAGVSALQRQIKASLLSTQHYEGDVDEAVPPMRYEADVDEDDIALDLLVAFPTPDSVDLDPHAAMSGDVVLPKKTSHVAVPDKKGGFKTMSKSLLCWQFTSTGSTNLSNARLQRVREQVLSSLGTARGNRIATATTCTKEEVQAGNWCIFKVNSIFYVVHILGFKYLSGKNVTYTLPNAPVQPPDGVNARGIACYGVWYALEVDILKLCPTSQHNFVNIEKYVATVPSPNADISGSLKLLPETLMYVQKLSV